MELIHAKTWMKLEKSIMLSGQSKTQKAHTCMILVILNIKNYKSIQIESRLVAVGVFVKAGMGSNFFLDMEFPF